MTTEQQPDTPRNPPPWRVLVPAVTLLAGLLFGVSAATAKGEGSSGRPTELASLVRDRAEHVEQLGQRVEELRTEVEELSRAITPVDERSTHADALAPLVGTAPVTGPAVQVSLDDAGYSLDTLPEGYTVDDVVVHEQDVQAVINALWAGGAEAMMVQDQRIVASSSVRCVGNTLYLQGRVYSPPYTITAIGDVSAMNAALDADPVVDNYRRWAQILGLGYSVGELDNAEFPGFQGTVRTTHLAIVDLPGGTSEEVPTLPPTDPAPTDDDDEAFDELSGDDPPPGIGGEVDR